MSKKVTPIKERASKGQYDLVEPFDYMIMGFLPEVGTLFAGLYPLGETVANIAKKFPGEDGKPIPASLVTARVRTLELQGLVKQTKGGTSKRVWQRTQTASKLYNEWKSKTKTTTTGREHDGGPSNK